jgi:hypothetical protein
MADYETMYRVLFNSVTNAVRSIERQNYGFARCMLVEAQQKTEELFLNAWEASAQDGEDGAAD